LFLAGEGLAQDAGQGLQVVQAGGAQVCRRLAEEELARVAVHLRGGAVDLQETPFRVLDEDGVGDAVEQVAIAGLGRLPGKPGRPFAQGALDGRRQADQVVLAHHVPNAFLEQVDRRFLADGAAEQDHRQVGVVRPDVDQGLVEVQAGKGEAGQDGAPASSLASEWATIPPCNRRPIR
jgi:hypothetical protein